VLGRNATMIQAFRAANDVLLGAVQGILLDADGDTIFNYFTEFGVAQPTELVFNFSTLVNGKAVAAQGYASFVPYGASATSFYTVNLLTGEVSPVGEFPLPVGDVAVSLTGY